MATTGTSKAATIQLKDLSLAVDKAVKLAADKHKVTFESGFQLSPVIINGRILREAVADLGAVTGIANEITQQVAAAHGAAAGHTLTPTVVLQGGRIICGFIAEPPAIFNME